MPVVWEKLKVSLFSKFKELNLVEAKILSFTAIGRELNKLGFGKKRNPQGYYYWWTEKSLKWFLEYGKNHNEPDEFEDF